jgi:cell fate regulator YaaT (PSP1 superfamily)
LYEQLKQEAKNSFDLFCKMLIEYDIKIKAIDVHYRFDRTKICFYIYSETHQDFRIFHRAVAAALHRRVAIKNVGVREYAKFLGGLGPCGKELCCRTFLLETKPVHLRMARQQNLFVEPNKISGYCGKLCCCLKFEEDIYTEALTAFPRIGGTVETKQGEAIVLGIDIFNRKVLVRVESDLELYIALDEILEWK